MRICGTELEYMSYVTLVTFDSLSTVFSCAGCWYNLGMRKCFVCRKEIKGNSFRCKKCSGEKIKTSSTLIIYNKI
jgi:predicted amidophosphoribosyltransferase